MKYIQFVTALGLLICGACTKYQTQFEGPYSDNKPVVASSPTFEILAVIDGQMHLYDAVLTNSKIVPVQETNITEASINFAHDKIAFKSPGGNIQVIDTSGKLIAEIAGSQNAYSFDWHSNNETLYYLKAGNLFFYGPSLPVPATNLNAYIPSGTYEREVFAVVVDAGNNVWFSYQYYTFSFGYDQYIEGRSASGQIMKVDIYSSGDTKWMRATRDGKLIYAGAYHNYQVADVWEINPEFNSYGQFDDYPFKAFSPGGDKSVFSDGETYIAGQTDHGITIQIDLQGDYLTSLDW